MITSSKCSMNVAGEITSEHEQGWESRRSKRLKSVQPCRWNHVAITSPWPSWINHVGAANKGQHVGAASKVESYENVWSSESVGWEA